MSARVDNTPQPNEISTAECCDMEIVCARAEHRLRVTTDGLGFISMLPTDPRRERVDPITGRLAP